jgi:hypothetical protein
MTEEVLEGKIESISTTEQKYCGIIMPIAPLGDYTADHWAEVKSIIIQATSQIEDINFKTEIVSNSDGEIDVIHKRIIQNIYNADIVVCDISGKNPNVLFELGMRLTFDKPTIIIKDDATDFIFDTGVIEHITYPKDLRFQKVVNFKQELAKRIKLTYEKAKNDPNFSTFLGSFGEFKVPNLKQTDVSDVQQLILDEISNVRTEFSSIKKEISTSSKNISGLTTNISMSDIKEVIMDYVEGDSKLINMNPEMLLHNKAFSNHMRSKGLDLLRLPKAIAVNVISEAQANALPF